MNIFAFDIEKNRPDINFADLIRHVTPDKRKRIKACRFREDAMRILIGDLLIRAAVCRYMNKRNENIKFCFNPYGKPHLADAENFHYNISHSGKWVVAAFDSEPVGIDVEAVVPIDLDIAQNLFSPEEVLYINNCPEIERIERFYEVWTLKESYFKALGCGLSKNPKSISLTINGIANIAVTDSVNNNRFLHLYRLDQGYCLAICTCHDEIPARVNEINLQWIMDRIR